MTLMDPLVEILFTAGTNGRLAETLRAALEEDGQQPGAERLAEWIAEGHVRVQDVVVRDPQHVVAAGVEVELSAWPAPAVPVAAQPAVEVGEILHLDRYLLVAEYVPASTTSRGSEEVVEHCAGLLAHAGRDDVEPVLVTEHDPRASGLVVAGLKPRGAPALALGSGRCGVRVSVKALVRGEPQGDLGEVEIARRLPGARLVRTSPIRSTVALRSQLEEHGLTVLEASGSEPTGTRRLLLHVAGLALTHPYTGHTQMWMCMQPPWFTAALKRLEAEAVSQP